LTGIHYCIICGKAFEPPNPEVVICPACSGIPINKPADPPAGEKLKAIRLPQDPLQAADNIWQPGQVILDTYEVKGELGKGGFGRVYRVHHKGWNMDLAVKRALNLDEQGKQAFIDEAQKWIDLGLHPHIISCYYVRNIDGFPHTFAELAEGGSLESWIQGGRHDLYAGDKQAVLARILDIAIQFAWGLGYAHEQGLVHQDVKPQNALMTPDGTLKVTDFGLARAKSQSASGDVLVTSGGYTPAYCSPEQAAGMKLSLKTDIWSWGVSVLEMFNGGVSWMGGQVAASALESYLGRAQDEEDIPPMPDSVADLLRECFLEDPQARPRDMLKIAERLMVIYQQETGQTYFREIPNAIDLRADSLNNQALSMLEMGNDQKALEDWDLAIKSDSLHLEAIYNLGLYRWRAGLQSSSELENRLTAIKAAKPENWRVDYLLGLVNLEKGNVENAKEILEEAEQRSPVIDEIQYAKSLLDEISIDVSEEIFSEHQYEVEDIVVSSNRQLVYSIDNMFNLCIWNHEDLSLVRMYDLSWFYNPKDDISTTPKLRLIEEENHVLVTGYYDFSFKQWDLLTGTLIRSYQGHNGLVYDVDIDLNHQQIISGGADGIIRLWDLKTGSCLRSIETDYGCIFIVRFILQGKLIIHGSDKTGYSSGNLIIYSMDPFREEHVLEGHDGDVNSVAFSPDGKKMLSGGHDSNAILWGLDQGQQLTSLMDNDDYSTRSYVWTVAISSDGKLAFVGDEFGKLEVWDLQRLSLQRFLKGHTDAIMAIAINPGDQSVLVGSREICLRHDLSEVYRYPAQWALCMARSVQQEEIVINEANRILNQASAALTKRDFVGVKQSIKQLREIPGYEWHPEAYEIWQEAGIRAGRRIDLTAFRKVRTIENLVTGPIKISRDGTTAVIAGKSTLKLYDLESGTVIREFNIQSGDNIQTVDTFEDLALSGSAYGCVHIWNLDTGECIALLNKSQSGLYESFFVHSGQSVILAREDGSVDLWHWKLNPGLSINLTRLDQGVRLSAMDPVHYYAALNKEGRELLWMDLKQKTLIDRIDKNSFNFYDGRLSGIENVAISPDGSRLFFRNNHLPEEQLGIWDLDNHFYAEYLLEHALKGTVSPDGRFIAISRFYWNEENYQKTQGNLEIVKLQDAAEILSGPNLAFDRADRKFSTAIDDDKGFVIKESTLETGNSAIEPIAFSLDGRYLFAARENDLQIWELLWEYDFPARQDWDEAASAYLKAFLHTHSSPQSQASSPSGQAWTEADFHELLLELGSRGFGWLNSQGVRRKLEEMANERG